MRYARRLRYIVLFVSLFFLSCDGGGGGAGSDISEDPELTRDRLFAQEAVFRVTDNATVGCDFVDCGGRDAEHFIDMDGILGTIFEMCHYRCLPVEIDESGEVRHFLVRIQWDRISTTCFVPEDGQVTILIEVQVACEPTL